jgi:hypothetical protein
MNILKNKLQLLVTLLFVGFIGWWISFQHIVDKQGSSVNWFENTYGLVALIGSIIGFFAMKKWGGSKTVLGKSLMFFALGLFAQEAGQLVSSYYTQIAKEQLPYPSFGDVAYFGSVLLYICAAIFLTKMAGVKFSLRQRGYKVVAVAIPLILLVFSYAVLLHGHQYDTTKPLTVFLDAGYPIGQACYISIAIVAYLLSRKLMGGIMKAGFILVIVALLAQYVSDFTFIYESHRNAYVPGKFDDLLYLIAYYVMTLAMIKFLGIYKGLSSGKAAGVKADKA